MSEIPHSPSGPNKSSGDIDISQEAKREAVFEAIERATRVIALMDEMRRSVFEHQDNADIRRVFDNLMDELQRIRVDVAAFAAELANGKYEPPEQEK